MKNVVIFVAVLFMATAANAAEPIVSAKATFTWSTNGKTTARTFAVDASVAQNVKNYDVRATATFLSKRVGDIEEKAFSLDFSATSNAERYVCDGIPKTFADDESLQPQTFSEEDITLQADDEVLPPAPLPIIGELIPRTFTELALAAAEDAVRTKIKSEITPMYRSYAPVQGTNILANGAGSATRP